MLAIYKAVELVVFQAPNSSTYIKKKVSQGKQPGAKSGHRKKPTSLKHNPMSKLEATKSQPSSKEAAQIPTGHSKRKKPGSAMDCSPSQPSA
ncbi:hypothetical protein Tco_0504095, partial [Tanacetum coccineum]